MSNSPQEMPGWVAGFSAAKKPTQADVVAARRAGNHSLEQASALVHLETPEEWQLFEDGKKEMGLALWELYLHKAKLLPRPLPTLDYRIEFDPDTGHTGVSIATTPQINMEKALFPMKPPTAPEVFCLLVGQLSIAWSDLEAALEALLQALLPHSQTQPMGKHLMFEAKKRVVLELCGEIFSDNPKVVEHFKLLMTAASGLQKERNLLAHGQKEFRVHIEVDGKGGATVLAELLVTGRYEGSRQTVPYSLDRLESIFYALCHLSKRLEDLVLARSGQGRGVNLPKDDIEAIDKIFGFSQ